MAAWGQGMPPDVIDGAPLPQGALAIALEAGAATMRGADASIRDSSSAFSSESGACGEAGEETEGGTKSPT